MILLNMAKSDCGDSEDTVSLAALRAHFKTPAWKDLGDESSPLSRFLLSTAFKKDGTPPDQICCSSLRIYAMMNCQGLVGDKAEALYEELQEGGSAAQQAISAGDKDLQPVFEKLCALASYEMFVCQDQVEAVYDEGELSAMAGEVEVLREDHYLEDIFGASARASYGEWMQR